MDRWGRSEDSMNNNYMDYDNFQTALKYVACKKNHYKGIGTLSEKTMHSVLKQYFEPNEDNQEVALNGYYADIFNESGVIEIQTSQLNRLRDKLSIFLSHYCVTVVYPCLYNKWILWMNADTKEICEKRKSPKHCTQYDAFCELYKIKMFLKNPNIKIKFVLLDVNEYKVLNGWNDTKKRGAAKYDKVPIGIRNIVSIEQQQDYVQFVPHDIKMPFTSKDYAKAIHVSSKIASTVLHILHYIGIVKRTGKKGNAYLYELDR
jgi:hypothetical protein